VVFDRFAKDWVVRGPGVNTAALELHNPDATDDQITTELYTFPIVYRAKIVRLKGLNRLGTEPHRSDYGGTSREVQADVDAVQSRQL
jgi:hypothetical protein